MLYCVKRMIYNFFLLFIKNKKIDLDETKAYEKIHALSPDPHSSCYIDQSQQKEIQNIKKYDLEIIIPAYNEEKYVRKCLESALHQVTEYNIHIILIDDGSTDNTAKIVDEYLKFDRLKIVHQVNKGFSGARNTGLSMINSKYVMFLDSDDYLPINAVQNLLECAFKNNADIVEGGYCTINESGKIKHTFKGKDGRINPLLDLRGQPWGKVIKSSLFNKVKFPEKYLYEDSIFRQIIYPQVRITLGIEQIVYFYLVNPKGISKTSLTNPKCVDSLYVYMTLYKDSKNFLIPYDLEYYEYTLLIVKLTFYRTHKMPLEIKMAIFTIFSEFIKRNWSNFHTKSKEYKEIEEALKNNEFWRYYFAQKLL